MQGHDKISGMKEQLANFAEIQCEACGNCCPTSCIWKNGKLCKMHPSIVGTDHALAHRGWDCPVGPLEIFANEMYCPPIVREIERVFGIKIEMRVDEYKRVWIANFDEIEKLINQYDSQS